MNKRQSELIEEIRALETELAEIEHIRLVSGMEEYLISHKLSVPPDHSVSSAYGWIGADVSLRLEALKAEYDQVADNDALLKSFGRDVHDLLKSSYPITHKTHVEDKGKVQGDSIYYVIPDENERDNFFNAGNIIPVMRYETGRAYFREIANGRQRVGYFAYAPEIDTVFVAR